MSILGRVSPQSTDATLLYRVPTGKRAVLNVSLTNRTSENVTIDLYARSKADLGVVSITPSDSGTGLTTIPTVSFDGASTTTAKAVVTEILLTEYELATFGGFYFVGDELTAEFTSGESIVLGVTSTDANGVITGTEIVDAGTITEVPSGDNVTLTGGNGNNASLDITSLKFGIKTVEVTVAGNGYTEAPTPVFSDGTGAVMTVGMTDAAIEVTDALEYNVVIPATGVLERTGILIGEGDALYVRSKTANAINAFAMGITELA